MLAVLREFLAHYWLGKFAGPFPKHVKTVNSQIIRFIRTFTIKKYDSSMIKPKDRVLINASEEYVDFQSFQPTPGTPEFED